MKYREYHCKEELMFYADAKLFLELLEAIGVQQCCNAIEVNPPQSGRWPVTLDHLQNFS
jgi:hypothetical protein